MKMMRWTIRIASLAVLLFGLPFYFGYANPLPFVKPEYTFMDNVWLSIFPLVFAGLAIGWKYEKAGGFLIVIPTVIGLVLGIAFGKGMVFQMLVPFVLGIIYLMLDYKGTCNNQKEME